MIDQAIVERMERLTRSVANGKLAAYHWVTDARAIVAILPAPVDPLVLKAREICADGLPSDVADYYRSGAWDHTRQMRLVLKALRS